MKNLIIYLTLTVLLTGGCTTTTEEYTTSTYTTHPQGNANSVATQQTIETTQREQHQSVISETPVIGEPAGATIPSAGPGAGWVH